MARCAASSEIFAGRPLRGVLLPIANRPFVVDRIARHVVQRLILRNPAPAETDHDGQLAFVVELVDSFGQTMACR